MLAYGINAAPATLVKFQDELGAILQNGMVNGTGIYSFGIHLCTAYGADGRNKFFGQSENFLAVGNYRTFNNEVGIFRIKKFYDIISNVKSPFNIQIWLANKE